MILDLFLCDINGVYLRQIIYIKFGNYFVQNLQKYTGMEAVFVI